LILLGKTINDEIERSIALKLKEELISEITQKSLRKQSESYANLVKLNNERYQERVRAWHRYRQQV